jgi:hypothetical protein
MKETMPYQQHGIAIIRDRVVTLSLSDSWFPVAQMQEKT